VDDWVDGGVQQQALVLGDAGVSDGPPQVARMHVFHDLPVILRVKYTHPLVSLKRACKHHSSYVGLSPCVCGRRVGRRAGRGGGKQKGEAFLADPKLFTLTFSSRW
jgi:hypothetical protein